MKCCIVLFETLIMKAVADSKIKLNKNYIEIIDKILKAIADAIILRKHKSIGLLGGDLGSLLFLYVYMQYTQKEKFLEIISNRLYLSFDIAKTSVMTYIGSFSIHGFIS